MNRNFRLGTLTLASVLALTPLAGAQQATTQQASPQQSSPQQASPAQPGRQAMRATFGLVRQVAALSRLGHHPGAAADTALSSAQASGLAALLTPLKTARTLTPEQARSISASIERLLTPAQRTALAQAGGRMGGHLQGQSDQPMAGAPGQNTPGQNTPGQAGPNGQAPAPRMPNPQTPNMQMPGHGAGSAQGGPQGMTPNGNPFLTGRGSQLLNTLLGQLQK